MSTEDFIAATTAYLDSPEHVADLERMRADLAEVDRLLSFPPPSGVIRGGLTLRLPRIRGDLGGGRPGRRSRATSSRAGPSDDSDPEPEGSARLLIGGAR